MFRTEQRWFNLFLKQIKYLWRNWIKKVDLVIGLGSDKSGLINVIQSCCKTCENLFPEAYLDDGKRSVIYDITGAGLHKELSTGNKFLLMHEADANLTKLGFYQNGNKFILFIFFSKHLFVFKIKILSR